MRMIENKSGHSQGSWKAARIDHMGLVYVQAMFPFGRYAGKCFQRELFNEAP
jgi:hypothetical protein